MMNDHPLPLADENESVHHPLAAPDQLQTLTLDAADDSSTTSTSDSDPPSDANEPAVSDPLLFPPHLDSPSYAHRGNSESNGNAQIPDQVTVSTPGSDSSCSDYLKISVSDPRKETNSTVSGKNTYFTYQISSTTNIDDYVGSSFSVRRRFKDVVTLADRLTDGYRGYFIPPRPDKSAFESQVMQKQDFVEQRRVELDKYLNSLAKHPLLKKSDELRVFLTVEGRMPLPTTVDAASRMLDGAVRLPKQLLGESTSVMEPQDVVHSAKSGRDMLRYLKELKQSLVNDWGNSKPLVEEEDNEFLAKKEKMQEYEKHLTDASKQAESFVKAQHDMGETVGELGLAFMKLTKFENEHATLNTQSLRAADMKCVATAAVKVSRLYRGLDAQTIKHFDTFLEHMGMMLAAHNAFLDRSSALLTVQTLMSELSSLQSRAGKLEASSSKVFGGDKSRTRKLDDLREAIRVTEDAKSCAIKEYERIKENNRSEIQRVDAERQTDFVEMLNGFVKNQIVYHEKIESEWAKVAEELQKYSKEDAQKTP